MTKGDKPRKKGGDGKRGKLKENALDINERDSSKQLKETKKKGRRDERRVKNDAKRTSRGFCTGRVNVAVPANQFTKERTKGVEEGK